MILVCKIWQHLHGLKSPKSSNHPLLSLYLMYLKPYNGNRKPYTENLKNWYNLPAGPSIKLRLCFCLVSPSRLFLELKNILGGNRKPYAGSFKATQFNPLPTFMGHMKSRCHRFLGESCLDICRIFTTFPV